MEHHARLYEGDVELCITEAQAWGTGLGRDAAGTAEVQVFRSEHLSIDEVRTLKERAAQKPYGSSQTFVVAAGRIMPEAQNALLKLLEEPPEGTYVALVVPSAEFLLPTVRSRLMYAGRHTAVQHDTTARAFMASARAERIAMLSKMSFLEDKDRTAAARFLDELEAYLYGSGDAETLREHARALREVQFVRTYVYDKGSSLKLLFEHLAVVLPPAVSV